MQESHLEKLRKQFQENFTTAAVKALKQAAETKHVHVCTLITVARVWYKRHVCFLVA